MLLQDFSTVLIYIRIEYLIFLYKIKSLRSFELLFKTSFCCCAIQFVFLYLYNINQLYNFIFILSPKNLYVDKFVFLEYN